MHLSIGRHFLILLYFFSFSLIHNCAKDASKKMLKEKLKKGRTLVSVLHTNHFFRQGHFGEEFVVTAQLRSLATKPIKHIILDVHVFNEAGSLIASRREAVSWKKDKRREKRKKYGNLKRKGWLLPGKQMSVKSSSTLFRSNQSIPGKKEKEPSIKNSGAREKRTSQQYSLQSTVLPFTPP